MVDASLVLDAIVAVSIAAGAVFAIVEMREIARTRKTQLVVDMMRHISTVEFSEQIDKVFNADLSSEKGCEKCGFIALGVVAAFFEELGLLIRHKLVDANLVHEAIGIANQWERMKPWCLSERARTDPDTYENFEYAAESERAWRAKRMRKRAVREAKQ